VIGYTIDALGVDDDIVAAACTGSLRGVEIAGGLGLYRTCGGLLRSTRHAVINSAPSEKQTTT
jgi:hypothetical protein